MKKIVLLYLGLFLISCIPKNSPTVSIKNNTENSIDSIKIFTSINFPIMFYTIKPKDNVEGNILFDKNNNTDGCYKFQMFKDGKIQKSTCFGYYTNGGSLNRNFDIIIENDTIKIKE